MKINWKLRLQNKATLTAIVLGIVAVIFQIVRAFGVAPSVTENEVVQIVSLIIEVLAMAGILIDPTTKGISDSTQALTYEEPKKSNNEGEA